MRGLPRTGEALRGMGWHRTGAEPAYPHVYDSFVWYTMRSHARLRWGLLEWLRTILG